MLFRVVQRYKTTRVFVTFSSLSSLRSRPHGPHKIHGNVEKKLTLSRPWTTAPIAVRAETRLHPGQYIVHAMSRTAATRTPRCEYAAHLARVDTVFGRKREKRRKCGKIHTITRAHEREFLTISRNRSRLNISCANSREFWRQRATPTGVSDMPVFAFPYKIERFRKRQRDKLDRHISNMAQATAILVRVEPS